MSRLRSGILFLALAVVFCGCGRAPMSAVPPQEPKDFTVEISGTEGLVVELLVVVKPSSSSIEKAVDEAVTIPYKRKFTGVANAVWVDGTYRGTEGEYTLSIGGSSCSGVVRNGARDQSCLHSL